MLDLNKSNELIEKEIEEALHNSFNNKISVSKKLQVKQKNAKKDKKEDHLIEPDEEDFKRAIGRFS